MSKTPVTKEIVEKVKAYLSDEKYSSLTYDEVALLCQTSPSTVSRITKGMYDHLLDPVEETVENPNTDDVAVAIDYQTLKHLMACEYAVEAMLKVATLHEAIEGALFVNNKSMYGILKAYLPDDVDKRLAELSEEEN